MAAGHNDPKLLYSIGGITAYHLQNGKETPLGTSGPQTMSLLMVPTSSPFSDLSSTEPQSAVPEEDFYLHLHLPPELDLPLPATTQIYHQPPRSYLIPRWDLGPDAGAFTRIEFPKLGSGSGLVSQEDVDTFETILAQCTAFLERAEPPRGHDFKAYNPSDYGPGEGYVGHGMAGAQPGQIVLVDEENGSVVGELSQGFNVVEGKDVHAGSKSIPISIATSSRRLTYTYRSGRDSASDRRRGEPDQCHQCLRRIPSYVTTSGLQRLNIGSECSSCVSSDCINLELSFRCDEQRSRKFPDQDEAESQANEIHSNNAGKGEEAEQLYGRCSGTVLANCGADNQTCPESGSKHDEERRTKKGERL